MDTDCGVSISGVAILVAPLCICEVTTMVSFLVVSWASRGKATPPVTHPTSSARRVFANMNISKGISNC